MNKKNILYQIIFISTFLIFTSCTQTQNQESKSEENKIQATGIGNFGKKISDENSVKSSELVKMLKNKDSVQVKIAGKIAESCTHSGCWMEMEINDKNTVYVTFENSNFTIPLDAAGKQAIIEGTAYREIVSIEELRKKAAYEKKSEAEIAKITMPDTLYNFTASGVIVK